MGILLMSKTVMSMSKVVMWMSVIRNTVLQPMQNPNRVRTSFATAVMLKVCVKFGALYLF
jgi:ABC-type glucose/galactose transport system permease subunit